MSNLIYTVTSTKWDDVWETDDISSLCEANPESTNSLLHANLLEMKAGEKQDFVIHGTSFSVSCREGESKPVEISDEESMARAIESLLDALRQRGAWPSDVDVDLTGYESWRASHPREDA